MRSYAGLPELPPSWVAEHLGELTILDVRSLEEVNGPDGRIDGSLPIPLPELEARSGEIPPIGRWWWSAIPAAVPPWPPSSCSRPALARWPTCAADSAAGATRAIRSKAPPPADHRPGSRAASQSSPFFERFPVAVRNSSGAMSSASQNRSSPSSCQRCRFSPCLRAGLCFLVA